ncbi:SEC14-like protein 2 isoform X1 [Daphnia pulicaria]|uniref:SEC14-like protein 2 isoform X1 n=1 Tax=Daphnia pulicaria TaxID=35523 RepID=UPI001EEC16A9|nr:SEC14-like protein 2 isoform X1 [Daphnia pulicaria]
MESLLDQLDEPSKRALKEFKERVQDCTSKLLDTRDEFYLKWLIARSYSVIEAEKMFRASLAWRQANGIDDILKWTPPEVLLKYFSFGKIGYDKLYSPVYVCAQGQMDLRGILQSVTKKDFMRYQTYMTERINKEMREESLRTGENQNCQMTFIADMMGLSMRQMSYKPVMDAGREQTKNYESNYPENIRRIFIINAPKIFTVIFNIIKPFLHQATLDKMRIFGSDKEEWAAALLEEIEADNLPLHYGGTMVDPDGDPKCPSKFNMGGEVPYSYYLSNSAPVPKDYMETINIIAGAGGFKKLKYKIDVVNSILRWEFMTEGGDIGFRVYYKSDEEGIVDLVPLSRIESHLVMEEGEFICYNPGKYVVVFDNTFSILRPKKVRYYVAVDPPVPGSPTTAIV